jgi:methionyl-tRNA formyltransferase
MNILVLTTQTVHHTYFVAKLLQKYDSVSVLLETKRTSPCFDTQVEFENERDEYEREVWFAGSEPLIESLTVTQYFESSNNPDAVRAIKSIRPDVTLDFGTGRLSRAVIEACSNKILNLHGGNPEEYRGLDSHYWAIYHHDFQNLCATIHYIDENLDTGNIIRVEKIKVLRGLCIHQLRRYNVEACLSGAFSVLREISDAGVPASRQQTRKGRYYSFMPACLKLICRERFEKYTSLL